MRCKAKWQECVCRLTYDLEKQAEACAFPFDCKYADWTEHAFDGEISKIDSEWNEDFTEKTISIYTGTKRKRLLVRGIAMEHYYPADCGAGDISFDYIELDGVEFFRDPAIIPNTKEAQNETL